MNWKPPVIMGIAIASLLAAFAVGFLMPAYPAENLERQFQVGDGVPWRVIDGDTMALGLELKIRLRGFDAPELFSAKCDAEKALALRAKERFVELLSNAKMVQYVSLVKGGEIEKDMYGRLLADVLVDGKSVADILVSENLGRVYINKRMPWCP